MTEKELIDLINADDSDQQYDEAKSKLTAELAKPLSEQNFERIDQLIQTIEHITGEDRITEEMTVRGIRYLRNKTAKKDKKRIRFLKWAAVYSGVAILLLNICSYTIYGMNVFSAAYKMLNGGINVDFTQISEMNQESDQIENRDSAIIINEGTTVGNAYAPEMQKLCNENGVNAMIPSYIPEGFTPADGYGTVHLFDDRTDIAFYFADETTKLYCIIKDFKEGVTQAPLGIPTDYYGIEQITIHGTNVSIIKEDQQFTAAFSIGNTQYLIAADGLNYDECNRVLRSIFE